MAAVESKPLYHLVQVSLWQEAVDQDETYYPPTYQQDGFTHATAEPKFLLGVANHFYTGVPGAFLLLAIDPARLDGEVKFEPAAPVGDTEAHKVDAADETKEVVLFPHIYGGIHPRAVTGTMAVVREEGTGRFLSIEGI